MDRPSLSWFARVLGVRLARMGDGVLMGADLQVTSQVLDELVSAFDGFGGRLTQACDDIRTGDGQGTGDDPLAGRVHDFAGSWHYGLTQLGQHGHECVKMLRQVGSTFDALDRELASELKRSQGVRSSS